MPNTADIVFAIASCVLLVAVESLSIDRRFKTRVAAGAPNARRNGYRFTVVKQWTITAIALLLWARADRPWAALGVVPPLDWHLVPGILIPALIVAFTIRQSRAVQRMSDDRRAAFRRQLGALEHFLPHTPAEHRWFMFLAVTAGFCEELLYRGFLTWLVAAYVGLPAAIGVVAIVFGLGHAYLGGNGVVKAGLTGLAMSLIVVLTGWLGPAMIVHALLDIASGDFGFAVYSDRPVTA